MKIAQLSGHAPAVKADLTGLSADTSYRLEIREFGKLGNSCADGGQEFNPLKETYYGVENPHADKTRGRIDGLTSDADGNATLH